MKHTSVERKWLVKSNCVFSCIRVFFNWKQSHLIENQPSLWFILMHKFRFEIQIVQAKIKEKYFSFISAAFSLASSVKYKVNYGIRVNFSKQMFFCLEKLFFFLSKNRMAIHIFRIISSFQKPAEFHLWWFLPFHSKFESIQKIVLFQCLFLSQNTSSSMHSVIFFASLFQHK